MYSVDSRMQQYRARKALSSNGVNHARSFGTCAARGARHVV